MMASPHPRPRAGFPHLPLAPSIQRGIAALGFTAPRPIQAQAIPAALDGRDVLGLAQTGTGKTAAFALPILQRLNSNRRPGPRAVIVAPTRELATQIHADVKALAQFTGLRAVTVFGGVSAAAQIRGLRARPDIVVACPGRLLDLMQQGIVRLDGVEVFVLDEADHLFDMGFLPDVRRILKALPSVRQNLLFAATMPAEVRSLADQVLRRPHLAELTHSKPAETIQQSLYPVSPDRKIDLLRHLLADDGFTSAIVFLRTKHRAKRLACQLGRMGHDAVALQGNMTQPQRDHAMRGFREGRFDVLVATDIAARGIDVATVSHVINFDVPDTPDAYTHRIGRTGRAERSGKAFTFVCDTDAAAVRDIERQLGAPIERRQVPGFEAARGPAPWPRPHRDSVAPRPAGARRRAGDHPRHRRQDTSAPKRQRRYRRVSRRFDSGRP
ncbi:MAG: DEAD/DEAH box helicase [Candidatus Binatia bacterium]